MISPMSRSPKHDDADPVGTLRRLLDGLDVAMLTTMEADRSLCSRPMQLQELDDGGRLWFFASRSSHQVQRERAEPSINLVFMHPRQQRYISVTGRVAVVDDAARRRALWASHHKIWWSGPDDPELVLLRVDVDHADYWEGRSTAVTRLIGFAQAMLTGNDAALGTQGRVEIG